LINPVVSETKAPLVFLNPPGVFYALFLATLEKNSLKALGMSGILLVQGIVLLGIVYTLSHYRFRLVSAPTSRHFSKAAELESQERPVCHCPQVAKEKERITGEDKDAHNKQALVVKGVSHWYGCSQVLDDLYLGLDRGECFGLLGPNGAGTSVTTLKKKVIILNRHS
jgi:ABC-type bacteriocin/lantibiotic exporter with double-glycine peptidase domain